MIPYAHNFSVLFAVYLLDSTLPQVRDCREGKKNIHIRTKTEMTSNYTTVAINYTKI